MIKNKTGVLGELYTSRYLRDNKYDLISSNYYCRMGEIDIIALKNDTLCFIEVKTRGQNAVASPAEFVDIHKQKRIILAAQYFLAQIKLECKIRFDVCEVTIGEDLKPLRINYIENAFEA